MTDIPTSWFMEFVTPDLIQQFSVEAMPYSGKTRFQSVKVIDTSSFGRCLVLDDKVQSSQRDEFIYHEALVHPAMLAHPNPRKVFIGGGGEGATLREVLAYDSVERVVMIDIDEEVIAICKEYLGDWHQGSFEDSRLELLHQDARKYLAETDETFDVIILDLAEPLEEGPAYLLFTREFYQIVKDRLAEGGLVSVQAGSTTMMVTLTFIAVNNTMREVFPCVYPSLAEVPSFGGTWGFALASKGPVDLTAEEVDGRIASRLKKELRFYDGVAHRGMFSLPKYLRREIETEKRIITDGHPLYTF